MEELKLSWPTAFDLSLQQCVIWEISIAARWGAGLTIALRTHTCRSDEESTQCCDFDK